MRSKLQQTGTRLLPGYGVTATVTERTNFSFADTTSVDSTFVKLKRAGQHRLSAPCTRSSAVEHLIDVQGAAGAEPAACTICGCSSAVECFTHTEEVAGAAPAIRTI